MIMGKITLGRPSAVTLFARFILVAGIAVPLGSVASTNVSFAADPYRYHAPNPQLKTLHKKMVKLRTLPTSQLRRLADSGDRLAAYFLARDLEELGAPATDTIHYFALAAHLGQTSAIDPLVGLVRLHFEELDPKRLEMTRLALEHAAKRNLGKAGTELAKFYLDGRPYGAQPAEAMALLVKASNKGNAEAAFLGATVLMSRPMTKEEEIQAANMLNVASAAGNIMAQAMLEELATNTLSRKPMEASQ
jgi:hypothetical protein